MNWKLCMLLSIGGLLMGIATIYVIPASIEPFFWLAIFIVCAILVARFAPGKYFLHGFTISLLNSVWVTLAHISRYDAYVATHPEFLQTVQTLPPALANDPRMLMALTGPIIGILTGLVLGLFCWIASKVIRPRTVNW